MTATSWGEPLINELMASNESTLADEDGAFSDWIEIYNPDATPANLDGWYLTDQPTNLKRWQFPAVTIPAQGYLVVFASNKNRRDPAKPLHTNFSLSASGEYLALVKPNGTSLASEIAPSFPAQFKGISYGIVTAQDGRSSYDYLHTPSPGAANAEAHPAVISGTVEFSRASGPFSSVVRVSLSGADVSAGQHIRYVIGSGPNALDVTPTSTSPQYTDSLVLHATSVVRAAVFSADDSAHGKVTTAHYLKVGSTVANFSSQLPVLVIDDLGAGDLSKDTLNHESWFYTYNAQDSGSRIFSAPPNLATALETNVRGSSSADFPKKSYNISFADEFGSKRSVPLLDLPAYEKWALVAPWAFDQNLINNAFVYGLSNRIGRWAPRTRLAEVFFNADGGNLEMTDYAGVYVVTDRIELGAGRVDIPSLSPSDTTAPAITGGYLLKVDLKNPEEIGWLTDHHIPDNGVSSIVLVSPKAGSATPAQIDYIRNYVQQMENALLADQATGWAQRTYLDFIDRASWVDHHILNTFVCNPDALSRSAYFHKNRGGKLSAGPVWDFDRSLGSYWDERSFRPDLWNGVGGHDFWRLDWWGIIAQDPEFMQDWIDRWQSLRTGEFSNANLVGLIDSLSGAIGTDAANRDAARWPDDASPYGSYAAQIEQMRTWIRQRAAWIDTQFLAAPTLVTSSGNMTFMPPTGAQLAYTLDGSDPRALGGDPAPNAQFTSKPLTVSAAANVHVRSYRAELRGVFPGSPWSLAVGGEKSSPLLPKARLINMSTRAIVGSGENALIAGVIVADTQSKRYLSRAVGPGLAAFGTTGVVSDPQLSIFSSSGVELFRNSGWQTGAGAGMIPSYARSVGAFPLAPGSRDSALANEVSAGAYTLQITTPSEQPGVGLVELYELDCNGRTVNLSTRAFVHTGDGVLLGGFVVQGPAYKRMLIRGVGPTLGAFGVSNALRDTVLTVYSAQGIVATNDRWDAGEDAPAVIAASKSVGAFNLGTGTEDAALLLTLPPGPYTVELKGKNNSEGIGLLEIYEIP